MDKPLCKVCGAPATASMMNGPVCAEHGPPPPACSCNIYPPFSDEQRLRHGSHHTAGCNLWTSSPMGGMTELEQQCFAHVFASRYLTLMHRDRSEGRYPDPYDIAAAAAAQAEVAVEGLRRFAPHSPLLAARPPKVPSILHKEQP